MIPLSQVKEGAECCLKNGKRLLEDARLLQENLKVYSAIPLFILAHEEIGKTNYLRRKLVKNENVSDKDWRELVSGGSHTNKIFMSEETAKELVNDVTEEDYFHASKFWRDNKLGSFADNRREAIANAEFSKSFFKNLNKLKKKCLYVDYNHKKWEDPQNDLERDSLYHVCSVLYWTNYERYLWHILFFKNVDEGEKYEKEGKIKEMAGLLSKDPTIFELQEVNNLYKTSFWKESMKKSMQLLNSL